MRISIVGLVRRLAADRRGATAVLFSLMLVPLVAIVGLAIDYGRAVSVRHKAQAALDSGLLAYIAEYSGISEDESGDDIARKFIERNVPKGSTWNWSIDRPIEVNNVVTIRGSGSGKIRTSFLPIIGFKELALSVTSTTSAVLQRTNVVLVVDTSDSMDILGRLTSMQAGLKRFSSEVYKLKGIDSGDRMRIGMVPFAGSVNLGSFADNATRFLNGWQYRPAPNTSYDRVQHYTPIQTIEGERKDVQTLKTVGGKTTFGVTEYEYKSGSWVNPQKYADRDWNNCIQMKSSEFGNDDLLPDGQSKPYPNLVQPGFDELCPVAASAMVADLPTQNDFDNKVSNLKTNYGTATAVGLTWGTRLLSPKWASFFNVTPIPWDSPADNPKYLVLMSDGGADHVFRAGDQVNQDNTFATKATVTACDFLKSKGVKVFTISYEMGGFAPTFPGLVALKKCASPGYAYEATTSNIGDVLTAIGANIRRGNVRVAK